MLAEKIPILEDMELSVKYIVMRGRRFNDLPSWNLDPQTRGELDDPSRQVEQAIAREQILARQNVGGSMAEVYFLRSGDITNRRSSLCQQISYMLLESIRCVSEFP